MTLTYQYPVVYFYGDDEEDSEIIRKEGQIEPLKTDKEPYEAIVSAEGYSFHILFGSQVSGMFLCIPGWHMGCELFLEVMDHLDMKTQPQSHMR